MKWSVVNEKAIRADGSLFFPTRLSREFLEDARRTMGEILFANQYLNEIIPEGFAPFKKEWLKYMESIPSGCYKFIMIDPAISTEEGADYTGTSVVAAHESRDWYVPYMSRIRMNPTEIVDFVFKINEQFRPMAIGIEAVAYQKALLYMLDEEMRRRKVILPVTPIIPSPDRTKEMRIMSLIPRFQWGRIKIAKYLYDFENEYFHFPRSAHDDILDSLSHMEELVYYPDQAKGENRDPAPNSPEYEKWYIANKFKQRDKRDEEEG